MHMSTKHTAGLEWIRLMGVAMMCQPENVINFVTLMGLIIDDSKNIETIFLQISTDSLCLRVAQMPRSRDQAIFVLTTDDSITDCFIPCTHARAG